MTLSIDDEHFKKVCSELENADTEGWEFFTESHDVKIYRLYNEVSGLYTYKVYGSLAGVAPDTCAQVYMDLAYRKEWDSYVNELREVVADDKRVIYWNVNYPFPMSNRDYVYSRELREMDLNGKKIWVVLAQSTTCPSIPEKSGVIRVVNYNQSCALTSDGKNGSKAYMMYYDDPRGMIPTWLINWAAKTGVPSFLTIMEKACKEYTAYKSKQQNCS